MSKRRSDTEYLADASEALARIQQYIEGYTFERFVADLKTQDAVIRNLEVAGEAAKQLSDSFRRQHPVVPWKALAGLRDRLIHHYFGVNWAMVWQAATVELPRIASDINRILAEH